MKGVSDRVKNSSLNVSSNVTIYIVQSILSFIVRTIFIRKLGTELLGLDSLFINILSMLSIVELGFGTAVSYGLYKPLAENKIKKISAYMSFYKKVYNIIGVIVIIGGLIVSIFLTNIVGDYNYRFLYLIYFMYLFNTASLYFISYKDILLFADQKNYKIFKYNFIFNSLMYVLQFITIYFFSNYIYYIVVMIICRLITRILINRFISKYYSNIDFKSKEKLTKDEIDSIKKNIFGLFCYKLGDYAINSSDTIIISTMLNLSLVGIYTNYLSITTILKTLIKNLFNGITASFGNLSTMENLESQRSVFKIMTFIGFIISGYILICLLNLLNPLIELWLGKKYLLSYISMVLISIKFYLTCNQMPLDTVKESVGFYIKDKYVPLIQAAINIVLSILLTYKMGFEGIIIATCISYIVTVTWNKPYLLNKHVFKISSYDYFFKQVIYTFTLVVLYFLTKLVLNYINLPLSVLNFIIEGIIVTFIYIITIIIIYGRTEEFKTLYNSIKGIIKREGSR